MVTAQQIKQRCDFWIDNNVFDIILKDMLLDMTNVKIVSYHGKQKPISHTEFLISVDGKLANEYEDKMKILFNNFIDWRGTYMSLLINYLAAVDESSQYIKH